MYVDWKSGGQVNFLRAFAYIWYQRWTAVRKAKTPADYGKLGIDYVVYKHAQPATPVYQNGSYWVYAVR